MKRTIATLLLFAVAGMAQTARKTKKTDPPAVAGQIVIPKDAKANPDGSFSWTDKQGKRWLFRNTPFGVMKAADQGAAASNETAPLPPGLKVVDAGDTVRFERPTPFGVTKWEKKKTELTPEEKNYLEQSSQPQAAEAKQR